ncbi:MAG: hypothetical protein ACE5G0_05210 [Rhodothermales bacterium]
MKRITTLLALVALCATLATASYADPGDKDKKNNTKLEAPKTADAAQWEAFSGNLVHALQSDHEGLKLSALQLVIQYGEKVDVDGAVFDVVRLYRDHKNEGVRRMAVVAMGKMQNEWAMDFLKRSERFEKSAPVLQTIQAVLADYGHGAMEAKVGA